LVFELRNPFKNQFKFSGKKNTTTAVLYLHMKIGVNFGRITEKWFLPVCQITPNQFVCTKHHPKQPVRGGG
jgi:hypothetical protein